MAARIALIGFGEVGGIFAADLKAAGSPDVAAYDLKLEDPTLAPALRAKAEAAQVRIAASRPR